MELGPIFKALSRNKTRFVLISLEVSLTLAIVVNCINMVLDLRHQMNRPTGLDEAGIIAVTSHPFAEDFKEDGYFENARKADLKLLRSLPGVRAADAFSAIPLSGSGSSTGYKPLGSEMDTVSVGTFVSGPSAIDALGVELAAGRNLTEDDINDSESRNVLVTRALADRLFPDGDALGKQVQGRTPDNPRTIVGIIEQMQGSWPHWDNIEFVAITPGQPGGFNWGVRYLVRVEPALVSESVREIEERLLSLNDGRNLTIETLADIKASSYEDDLAVMKMLSTLAVLLVLVTSLGIIGMTSSSVTERMHHIGTRRALGARRVDILRYFLTENWIITGVGALAGVVLAFGLNYALVRWVEGVALDWVIVALGVAGMCLVGQLATLVPAWRGAQISPAIATRNL